MFNIVASDLDGTLLTPNNQLTPFTKKILHALITHNIHFIFATGRHHKNVMKIQNDLKIYDYIITSNGARIHNPYGKLITAYNLDKDIILDLIAIEHHNKEIITNIFQNNQWLINQHQSTQQKINANNKFHCDYQIYQLKKLSLNNIFKIYFTSDNNRQLLSLEKKIKKIWGTRTNISFSLPTCLEVMPKKVSKGHALKKVANLLGCQLKDCITFGDGMNDLEMLSMTGKGCIMSNASQRLKKKLPHLEIIGSNQDEAVAHYLNQILFTQ